jgi:hypothetical protein
MVKMKMVCVTLSVRFVSEGVSATCGQVMHTDLMCVEDEEDDEDMDDDDGMYDDYPGKQSRMINCIAANIIRGTARNGIRVEW